MQSALADRSATAYLPQAMYSSAHTEMNDLAWRGLAGHGSSFVSEWQELISTVDPAYYVQWPGSTRPWSDLATVEPCLMYHFQASANNAISLCIKIHARTQSTPFTTAHRALLR